MNKRLRSLIDSAAQLSIMEQLQLMQAISQSLYKHHHKLITANFKKSDTLEELAREQNMTPITALSSLAVDFWPEQESVDEFIRYTDEQRKEDGLRND